MKEKGRRLQLGYTWGIYINNCSSNRISNCDKIQQYIFHKSKQYGVFNKIADRIFLAFSSFLFLYKCSTVLQNMENHKNPHS
jgi:hypothetical protein